MSQCKKRHIEENTARNSQKTSQHLQLNSNSMNVYSVESSNQEGESYIAHTNLTPKIHRNVEENLDTMYHNPKTISTARVGDYVENGLEKTGSPIHSFYLNDISVGNNLLNDSCYYPPYYRGSYAQGNKIIYPVKRLSKNLMGR